MKQEPIIFKQGEENGIVIERDHFERSIFKNQYQQAIDIFNRLWRYQRTLIPQGNEDCAKAHNDFGVDNQFSNIIAFCGDRGEGKSSCMSSFATILTNKNACDNALTVFPKLSEYENCKIEWLDVIDPSFFDTSHNLLELLLGRMYAKTEALYKEKDSDNSCTKAHNFRLLLEQFQKVKKDIAMVEKSGNIYDSLEEISDLAAGVQLKSDLKILFKYYLDSVEKDCLLICIDDLDLNISEGYKMAEMLRKYLICPYCVILVAVKVEQLIEVVATALMKEVKDSKIAWEQCLIMAQKYVTKLLPREQRVVMPDSLDICERRIQIAVIGDNATETEKKLNDLTVKERVVQLIFQKTGYVFYNTQHPSPIVPKNLRSLRHLIGTLEAMPDCKNADGDNEMGREMFKDYFFNTWAKQLRPDDYSFARQLSEYTDLPTFNAFVIEYFAKRVKDAKIEIKPKDDTLEYRYGRTTRGQGVRDNGEINNAEQKPNSDEIDEVEIKKELVQLYMDITNRANTSTNISLGDVMYVLWIVSTITVDTDLQNLIFFINTVYSMRLYACYNDISESKETLYPTENIATSKIYIHKVDRLYNHVNRLQRLVNGAYFSYPQGAFLSNKQDRKSIPFDKVRELLRLLDAEIQKPAEARSPEFEHLFQLCEYLALCFVRTTTDKEKDQDKGYNRIAPIPTYLGTFSSSANYIIFDFLNPFYALCNVEYAYRRFDEIMLRGTSLYELAEEEESSLLYQMIHNIRNGWYNDFALHGVLSDAVIRVIDVQWAIYEELLRQRRKHRVGAEFEKIRLAYKDIQDLNITLFPKIHVENNKVKKMDSSHTITFQFLQIISQVFDYKDKDVESAIDNLLGILKPSSEAEIIEAKIREAVHVALKGKRFPKTGKVISSLIIGELQKRFIVREDFNNEVRNLFPEATSYSNKEEVMSNVGNIINLFNNMIASTSINK